MTTANNIEAAGNQATQTEANSNLKEAFKMTIDNHIQGINSFVSSTLKTNRIAKTMAGLMIGGMFAAAAMLPGNSSADTPARPVGELAAAATTANFMDLDLLDPGVYDTKVVRPSLVWENPGFDPYENVAAKVIRSGTSGSGFDMDLLDPGIYDAKLVRSSNTVSVDDWTTLTYSPKVIRSGSSASGFDMDLLDPGIYDAKLVRTSPSWEGLQNDNVI